MKTLNRISLSVLVSVLSIASAFGQTATPSTTLCAAITSVTANNMSICLTSTANVHRQTGIYIDYEYMTVLTEPTATTNAYVQVARGNQSVAGPPAAHNNASIAWIALRPQDSTYPGANGFDFGAQFGDYGPCTRTVLTYLPKIWPARGLIRDCATTAGATTGQWVNYTELGQTNTNGSLVLLPASGAVASTGGNYVITKAGVAALTLAAPTAGKQDGTVIRISSTTANAHTLTATGLLQTGSASVNLATFAAQAGAGLTLMSYNGKWIVLYSVGVTFS